MAGAVRPGSVPLPPDGLHGAAREVALDAVVERLPVDGEHARDGLDGAVHLRVAVRRAHHEGRRDHAAPDQPRELSLRRSSDLAKTACSDYPLVHRSGDQIVPYELGREIAALVPSARLVTLDGVNHAFLLSERAQVRELARALTDFLAPDLAPEAPPTGVR